MSSMEADGSAQPLNVQTTASAKIPVLNAKGKKVLELELHAETGRVTITTPVTFCAPEVDIVDLERAINDLGAARGHHLQIVARDSHDRERGA